MAYRENTVRCPQEIRATMNSICFWTNLPEKYWAVG